MGIIVPAIIPASRQDLEEKLARLSGLCEEVQIDIVDGVYASPASWPYTGASEDEFARMRASGDMLPYAGSFRFEIDLMSRDAESAAGSWIDLGASRLTVHAEGMRYLARFLEDTRARYGNEKDFASGLLSLGLALGTETDLSLIEPFLERVDYVQFMGIRTIGHQGEPFSPSVIPRIAAFKKQHPGIEVTVDGGVTRENAPKLLAAGVSRLIVGSAIWKAPDPVAAYRALDALTQVHGIYE
jgi:ribulose-phosphate 3-epimerase